MANPTPDELAATVAVPLNREATAMNTGAWIGVGFAVLMWLLIVVLAFTNPKVRTKRHR